jgi:hypothetical protein
MSGRMARFALRRLRRHVPEQPDPAETGPVYRTVTDNDVVGCRLCVALRELLTFAWATDTARFNRLMDDGGCYYTAPGLTHIRIDPGEDFSMFKLIVQANNSGLAGSIPLWFRNSDMVVEGSNRQAVREAAQ